MRTKEPLIVKIKKLLDNEIAKEKDKYMSGMKNDYFNIEEEAQDILDSIQNGARLKAEIAILKQEVKRLDDKLWGRN